MPRMDVGRLKKGQWVPPHRLEILFGVSLGSSSYDAKFMVLKNQIEDESYARGKPLLCRRIDLGLKIMTDKEALNYKAQQQRRTIERLYKIQDELGRIDRSKLNEEDQYALDDEAEFQAAITEAIGNVVSKITKARPKAA